jgi:hypothetical protein
MLKVRICTATGAVIAEGMCSDSGYLPLALSDIYNAGLDRVPARSLQRYGSPAESDDYPVGTGRARFGYTRPGAAGGGYVFDDEVIVQVERT